LILFNDNREIVKIYHFDVKLNESTKLIKEVDNFLKSNNLSYFNLENIVVVN
jgi:tRNA A37 threonylcarbamoyladenosine modification protein TsaB